MAIHEPMTVATDYLMAIAAVVFGVRLWRARSRVWAGAFFATALASVLGGTFHGLAWRPLWKPTVYSVGVASLLLLAGLGRGFAFLGAIKFVAYAAWMTTHDDFFWVIADYGVTLLVVGAWSARAWYRSRAAFAPWVLGAIAVSFVGAAVQQSGMSLHRHFNHNDLYHLIQIAALWLLHRGGLLLPASLQEVGERPTDEPTHV